MTTTPNEILRLAREALRLEHGDHEMAAKQRFRAACTPTRIARLCELLKREAADAEELSGDDGYSDRVMATDTDAPTEGQEQA